MSEHLIELQVLLSNRMPSPPKIFFPGSLHFITTSVVKDLMFPANPLVNEVIKKSIAQSQALHPVEISHLNVLTTHTHMLMRVIDPQDAADFMERFKTESAHAINRLVGVKKGAVWCEGYDSPLIEDLETAMQKITYIYENPSKDGMTQNIDLYPGVNSWRQFSKLTLKKSSKQRYETRHIPRDAFSQLPSKLLLDKDYQRLRRKLIHKKRKNYFDIDCNSWMRRFGITDRLEMDRINQRIIETAIGAPYIPSRTGRKMLVHSVNRKFRKRIITWLKTLIEEARYVLSRWRYELTVSNRHFPS